MFSRGGIADLAFYTALTYFLIDFLVALTASLTLNAFIFVIINNLIQSICLYLVKF